MPASSLGAGVLQPLVGWAIDRSQHAGDEARDGVPAS
jgi:hypothetical protein